MQSNTDTVSDIRKFPEKVEQALRLFHEDESGVAMTEYIIVFAAITFGSTLAIIGAAAYVKAYRDFLIWWIGHPAV